jgi:hypothetical protein
MHAMPAKRTAPEKPKNPRAKGLKPVVVRLEPAQIAALKAEALRRANERGSMKPDASELVREALALWLRRR